MPTRTGRRVRTREINRCHNRCLVRPHGSGCHCMGIWAGTTSTSSRAPPVSSPYAEPTSGHDSRSGYNEPYLVLGSAHVHRPLTLHRQSGRQPSGVWPVEGVVLRGSLVHRRRSRSLVAGHLYDRTVAIAAAARWGVLLVTAGVLCGEMSMGVRAATDPAAKCGCWVWPLLIGLIRLAGSD
jgi:hypothetical protein